MKLKEHPTVIWFNNYGENQPAPPTPIDAKWLQDLCLSAGADDVGFVHLDNPALDDQREGILQAYPKTKALISIILRMNREPIKSTARSIANREFHTVGHDVDAVTHRIVRQLEDHHIGALNPSMAFPMEMSRFPGEPTWVVSHKPVAEAAGMGVMGIHRNVIHPKFGNFILLGTILVGQEISEYGRSLDFNPCLKCKLCIAACPVGAISADGHFNGTACLNHNYREFFGGFVEWAETLADSKNAVAYREEVTAS
ncbi:MAG: 4Fe-4S binding protein, partial [Chloroflexota bacterium]